HYEFGRVRKSRQLRTRFAASEKSEAGALLRPISEVQDSCCDGEILVMCITTSYDDVIRVTGPCAGVVHGFRPPTRGTPETPRLGGCKGLCPRRSVRRRSCRSRGSRTAGHSRNRSSLAASAGECLRLCPESWPVYGRCGPRR